MLAALFASAILFADSVNVTFDAALTNETEWVHSEGVKITTHVYFSSGGESIRSPLFPFAITNISLNISCSSTTPSRKLFIKTAESAEIEVPNVREGNKSEWKSFTLSTKGSSGNWHLYAATISGVPIVAPPADLCADNVSGARFVLSWMNPGNAISNRINVARISQVGASGDIVECFDFSELAAKGNLKPLSDFTLPPKYESISGSYLYAATNSSGWLQLSNGDNRGELFFNGLESYDDITLLLSLKRYKGDSDSMSVEWTNGNDITNELKAITLHDDFSTECINLASVDNNASILLNGSGTKTKHRVIIDQMSFIHDYVPAHVETNLVKTAFTTGSTTYSVRGLSPWTEYIATITAFDADGNESEQSEPIAVSTNGEAGPFSIHIQ